MVFDFFVQEMQRGLGREVDPMTERLSDSLSGHKRESERLSCYVSGSQGSTDSLDECNKKLR